MIPEVKVCCISSIDEAELAITAGAKHLGLVGPMPSGPGIISLDEIKDLSHQLSKRINTWILTSETSAEDILQQYEYVQTSCIQIVDKISSDDLQILKTKLPKVKLVQVIHVYDETALSSAKQVEKFIDYLLLDSGNPKLKVKELGGTGRTHNWDISARIVKEIDVPVFLAGGLNPSNVQVAVKKVKPYGLDLCSGLRTENNLDSYKLKIFFNHISNLS